MAKTTIPAGYIAANAVTSTELAANSVTAAAIASGAILSIDIGANSVSSTAIAANAVDSSEIASNAVGTSQIAGDAVTAAKIADNAVGSDQIAANAVGSSELASGALSGQNFTGDVTFDTDVLFVDSANNRVGVGTSSPSSKLEVNGYGKFTSSDNTPRLYLTGGRDYFLTSTASGIFGVFDNTGSSYRMVIGSSGNVGINTTSPATLLHIKAGSNLTTDYPITIENAANSLDLGIGAYGFSNTVGTSQGSDFVYNVGRHHIFKVDGNEKVRFDEDGNVGIGTTSPTGKLTIANPAAYAPNTITAANTYIQLGSTDYGSGGSSSNDGKFMIGFGYTDGTTNTHSPAYIGYEETTTSGDTYGDLTFYTRSVITDTAPTKRMSIASDGKIDMYPSGAETTGGLRVVYDGDNNYEVARFQGEGNQDAHISFISNGTTGYYWGIGIDYSDDGAFKISNDNLLAVNNKLRIDRNGDVSISGNMNAPGTIVQTVRAGNQNATGTGSFDIVSVSITPKFANSDMIIHAYLQWSVLTNNADDWGIVLQRDGTNILGESENNYFISGGGVDAYDWIGQGSSTYGVNFASKTDIDTGRSSSTSAITYKLRRYAAGGTSKNVIFGIDGWGGGGSESQRSVCTLVVQEVLPN